MSGRAVSFSTLRIASLAGVGPGSDTYQAWDQLFFDSFTIAVTQTAAITIEASQSSIAQTGIVKIEAKLALAQTAAELLEARIAATQTVGERIEATGYTAHSVAANLESDSLQISQTAVIKVESRLAVTQSRGGNLESYLGITKTAQPYIEARGYVNAALVVIKIEAGGAAAIPQTAKLLVEFNHRRTSYYPAPKSYYEAYKQHYVTGVIPVESKGITITQQASLPLAATEDPAGVATMTIELRPHDVAQSLDLSLESRFGIATRRWLLIESPGGTPSTGQGEIPYEIGGTTPANDQIVPIESGAPYVTQTRTIPVEQRFISAHGVGRVNAESRGFVVVPRAMPVEIERMGTVVPLPAGAEGILTIVRTAAESLVVREALPLSES